MTIRYHVKSDQSGWTVVDIWTGQPVRFEGRPQAGLKPQRAEILAGLLNWRAERGDRRV